MKDYLNINEAARETGLSIPTIRTKLERGLLPNAHQVPNGKRLLWRIPISDLSFLLDKVSTPKPTDEAELRVTALEVRIDQLEAELRHTRELLDRADTELEGYRTRERQLFNALETKQVQDRRRFSWFNRS